MAKKIYVGVDLGGTNVCAGLVDSEGTILARDERPTLARVSAEAPLNQICDTISQAVLNGGMTMADISGIGIGSPGPLDAKRGLIMRAGNLPHWYNFPLVAKVKERLGPYTCVQNDATVSAFGEWWMGAGKGLSDFFVLTLGTGIGGGAVSQGKLLTGFNDNACEFGHTSIDMNGVQCWCGQRGCIESYASANGIVRMANEALTNEHIESSLAEFRTKPDELSSKMIFDAAMAGDKFAEDMFRQAGYYLGCALVNALNILNFEVCAIGGKMARAGDLIFEPARKALYERGFQSYVNQVKIVPAEIPDDAAILGAARLVIEQGEAS